MVYVLDAQGNPLMPTSRHGKVRRLLKEGKAKVIKRCPFVIQLLYNSTKYVQNISLGIDAGSKYIGASASTQTKVMYEAEIELRNDIVNLLSSRKECRRARRYRKTRYRKPRFNNRVSSKKKGWLAPSVKQKVQTHLTVIDNICHILPIKNIIVEVASFDTQKLKNPNISNTEYQHGEQEGFWNVREYVLFRDNHTCQCCKGKSKDQILNVHHIKSRKTGGNSPSNLVTLCKSCHRDYHKGLIKLPNTVCSGKSFRDAAFMSVMKKTLILELKKKYSSVQETYGYITKRVRISHNLPKGHYIDARCISGNPNAQSLGYYYFQKKVRCHNRKIHKQKIYKGGLRKNNQAPYFVKGFRLFDKVKYKGEEYFVFGRRNSGYFDIRNLAGIKVNNGSINYKNLLFVSTKTSFLTERRKICGAL